MANWLPPLRLTGARVLRDGIMQDRTVAIADGRIDSGAFPAIDLRGYYVLPGIVDLHGRAFTRHIAPEPSAPFAIHTGLASADREAAANGVTTAWLAQSWSWEGGMHGPDFVEDLLDALALYRADALTDMRVQIRYETHEHDSADRLLAAVRRYGIDYVMFNNHINEALQKAQMNPADLGLWAQRSGKTSRELLMIVNDAMDRTREVPRRLSRMAEAFDTLGVQYGSHDDPDAETRETFSMIGAKICEFPMTRAAASVAKAVGNPVIMGAPNVVRGGSQAGNVAAVALVRSGKCDALVSDFYYPALLQAAFRLVDDGVCDLPAAWALISQGPAQIMGLPDRGEIAQNKRADLVVINRSTRAVEATICGGQLSFLAGEAAYRFMSQDGQQMPMAAE